MVNQRVQKSDSWTPQPQAKSSRFVSPPIPNQAKAPTPKDIENQAFMKHKHEALGLQLQAKYGTITPQGQERLTLLQAKMEAFRQNQLKSIPHTSLLDIPNLFAPSETPQPIQPKLKIGQVDDVYEKEADRVAASVVSQINAPQTQSDAQGEALQREQMPDYNEEQQKQLEAGIIQREEMPDDEEELQMQSMVQRQPGEGEMAATPELESSIKQAKGSGQSLSPSIRQPMEQAFGADFSRVKVHTDAQSDQLNQSIQAKAFTTGRDIFFRQGAYDPGSRGGQELLAHELTHVIQQNGSAVQAKPDIAQRTLDTVIQRKWPFSRKKKVSRPTEGQKSTTADQLMETIEKADPTALAAMAKNSGFLNQLKSQLSSEQYDRAMALIQPDFMGFRSAPPASSVSLPSQEPNEDILGLLNFDFAIDDEKVADPSLLDTHKGKKGTIPAKSPFAQVNPDTSIGGMKLSFKRDVEVTILGDRIHNKTVGYVFSISSQEYWIPQANITLVGEAGFEKTNAPLFPLDASGKPQLPSPNDVKQGEVGDCYLEAAIASIAKTNPQYIFAMMRDYGDTVSVRLFEVDDTDPSKPKFTPKYIKIDKSVAKSAAGKELYNQGALWVSILEKAYAAGGFGGTSQETANKTVAASYGKIEGGFTSYALSVLLGTASEFQPSDSGEAQENRHLNQLPWSPLEIQAYKIAKTTKIYTGLVSYTSIFKDETKVDAWMSWVGKGGYAAIRDLYNKKKGGKYKEEIRLEDLDQLFQTKKLRIDLIPDLLKYLEKYFPGKRGTGKYTEKQIQVYNNIEDKLAKGQFVGVSTKEKVGRTSTGSGHSGGEPQSKGLAGGHAYTVLGCKQDGDLRYVRLRNPWGIYGREYDFKAAKGGKAKEGKGDFWLELSDLTKRFQGVESTV